MTTTAAAASAGRSSGCRSCIRRSIPWRASASAMARSQAAVATVPLMEPVVVDGSVEGDGRGALTVRWRLEGSGPVEIAVGPTPEAVDHGHPVAVVEGERSIVLHDLGPGRHYVSIAPAGGGSALVVAERLVALEGTSNF